MQEELMKKLERKGYKCLTHKGRLFVQNGRGSFYAVIPYDEKVTQIQHVEKAVN